MNKLQLFDQFCASQRVTKIGRNVLNWIEYYSCLYIIHICTITKWLKLHSNRQLVLLGLINFTNCTISNGIFPYFPYMTQSVSGFYPGFSLVITSSFYISYIPIGSIINICEFPRNPSEQKITLTYKKVVSLSKGWRLKVTLFEVGLLFPCLLNEYTI